MLGTCFRDRIGSRFPGITMKTRRFLRAAVALAAGLVVHGCGSSHTSGEDPGYCEGLADGTPCGDPTLTACSGPDTCLAGVCVKNDLPEHTACGDATASECNAADTCDGAGMCLQNHLPKGTACGDPTATECNGADTCNGFGNCVANLADATTACGDATETDCDHADTCNGLGTCVPNVVGVGAPCGDPTDDECNDPDSCDGAGTCLSNFVAANTACGDPTDSECTSPDTCDGAGACAPNHVAANTPCGSPDDTECDDPDVCDGAGSCSPNYADLGTACGSPTETECNGADACDGAGACDTHVTANDTYCYDCDAGPGLCDVCSGGVCNTAAYCSEPGTTLMASNTAGNNHRGNMFDLVATNTVTITAFDASPMGNTTIEVYYKPGTWNGFANTPSAWTRVGSGYTPYVGGFSRVPLTVDVTIPAGETYAFYVTSNTSAVNLNYSNGTAVGNVYSSDANLTFLEGGGMEYPFTAGSGAVYQPRVWNGNIHYVTATAGPSVISTIAATYEDDVEDGVMFDVEASDDTMMRGLLEVELEAGTHDVDVYFRRGSYVGFEGSASGWIRIGGLTGVTSAGAGALTSIPLVGGLLLTTGEIGALYVDTHGTGLRTSPGTTVGDVAVMAGALTIRVGNAIDADFGGVGPAAVFRGSFQNPVCQ